LGDYIYKILIEAFNFLLKFIFFLKKNLIKISEKSLNVFLISLLQDVIRLKNLGDFE